jgi:3-deoxy-manno-octulosonate cytidylyltransferase (CMP-KDO synthetase)
LRFRLGGLRTTSVARHGGPLRRKTDGFASSACACADATAAALQRGPGLDIKKTRSTRRCRDVGCGFFMPDHASSSTVVAVIPARYASSRLPGKPLADIGGQTMIERVLRRVAAAKRVDRVIVATDDDRVRRAIEGLGEVVLTAVDHESGSDRVAEAVGPIDCDIVVNVQGDLPLIDPAMIDSLVAGLLAQPEAGMATVAVPVRNSIEFEDPSVVKVVCDLGGRALYFTRAPVPHDRDVPGSVQGVLHHVGIYAYRREVLLQFADLAPTPLERKEKLEQLRALENGIGIAVVACDGAPPPAVDTVADLQAVRELVAGLESDEDEDEKVCR